MQFPPSQPWSDSEAEAFRDYLVSPAGRRVLERLRVAKPSAERLISARKVSADIALGILAGFDTALTALVDLAEPPSNYKPEDTAKTAGNYQDLDDDRLWEDSKAP